MAYPIGSSQGEGHRGALPQTAGRRAQATGGVRQEADKPDGH
jgi:hypothetical protein